MQFLWILLQTHVPGSSWYSQLILMGGIILVFYFFMIRPQLQKQKKEKQFRESLKKGDKIITVGGLHARIVQIDTNSVLLEVSDNIKLRYERSAILRLADTSQES
ncbi:MAG: preprotein translocase subunit YajC [Bacteroidia bacterium]|nr:preprotein translocase subunit YajC [Bacteroidia bacterium]